MHILPNISRRQSEFGQSVDYNMRNIFFKTSYTKSGEKASPDPFLKNHRHVKKVGHNSELTFSINYWTWKKQLVLKKTVELGKWKT